MSILCCSSSAARPASVRSSGCECFQSLMNYFGHAFYYFRDRRTSMAGNRGGCREAALGARFMEPTITRLFVEEEHFGVEF